MKTVLLSAGLGTRLRPITDSVPKCLVPIHGKPLLGYWLDLLCGSGITDVLINTHYMADSVEHYVKSSRWKEHVRVVHEARLLGTAGTLRYNRGWLQDGAFMVAHADNLTNFNVQEFIDRHDNRPPRTEMTIMTFDTDCPENCGIVETDHDGIVRAFHEKVKNPPGTRANAAVYIFEQSVLNYICSFDKEVIDISTEVLPHYVGKMYSYHNTHYHRDIGTPESLQMAESEFVTN